MMTAVIRCVRIAAMLGLLAVSAACARPVGDLGRAEPSVLHDRLMPAAGQVRARGAGEPVSRFNLTDQEREMHDRVWRFLVAPHARDWFHDMAVELQRTRLASDLDTRFAPDRYYDHLRTRTFASSRVRYRAVANDIEVDLATLPKTFAAICTVIEVDRRRGVAVSNVARGAPDGPHQVAARHWENQAVIGWFVRALGYRYEAYSVALDRLLVETPHEEARHVNALLADMEPWVARARAHDFCKGAGYGSVTKDGGIPSRFESPAYLLERTYRK